MCDVCALLQLGNVMELLYGVLPCFLGGVYCVDHRRGKLLVTLHPQMGMAQYALQRLQCLLYPGVLATGHQRFAGMDMRDGVFQLLQHSLY